MPMNDETITSETCVSDARMVCDTSQGIELQAPVVRLARHEIVFHVLDPGVGLRVSEVLANFRVLLNERNMYSGRAVVSSLVNTGSGFICHATLDEPTAAGNPPAAGQSPAQLAASFAEAVQGWQKVYRILPEFKIAVADIESFLHELRHWTERLELSQAMQHGDAPASRQGDLVSESCRAVTPFLNSLFEKFELVARRIDADLRPAHAAYVKRLLHPLLLCSPFMHRIFRKPLGYAGDYEMVNMILRDPQEGPNLFARVLNSWFLSQDPAEAHRNRVQYLARRFTEETINARERGATLKVFNLGCGPAGEVAEFMTRQPLSDSADFTLLDFNEETLAYTEEKLAEARRRHGRRTGLHYVKKSVAQVLKSAAKFPENEYDLIYCAGLFDYLPDRVCQQLMDMFHRMLKPSGLIIATNVDVSNPIIHIMGYIFEWHLIYRTGRQLAAVAPAAADPEFCRISADLTGSNIFLEVRKPAAS